MLHECFIWLPSTTIDDCVRLPYHNKLTMKDLKHIYFYDIRLLIIFSAIIDSSSYISYITKNIHGQFVISIFLYFNSGQINWSNQGQWNWRPIITGEYICSIAEINYLTFTWGKLNYDIEDIWKSCVSKLINFTLVPEY